MTKAEKRQEWEHLINDYRASGQTAKEWCTANDLPLHRLWYWLRRQKTGKVLPMKQARWLPVEMEPVNHDGTLLVRIGAASIEVRPGFDPDTLYNVVRVLSSC